MVSFLGLKFGDRKKNSKGESPKLRSQPWKKIDQNQMGEGQYFGTGIHNKDVVNGSVISERPETADALRSRTFYDHDTASLAANSMYDLSKMSNGYLKQSASAVNIRSRFDGSSTNLSIASPEVATRPGTSQLDAPAKTWVNPLDVHFIREALSPPRSPLSQYEFGTDSAGDAASETTSLFGSPMEDVVDAVMASVEKKESEKQEKERELQKQRETARLEQERLERQRGTETKLKVKPLPLPLPPPQTLLPSRPGRVITKDGFLSPRSPGLPPRSNLSPKLSEFSRQTPSPSGLSPMPPGSTRTTPSPNGSGAMPNVHGRKASSSNSNSSGQRPEKHTSNRGGPKSPGLQSSLGPGLKGHASLNPSPNGPLRPDMNGPHPIRNVKFPNGRTPVGCDPKSPSPVPMPSPLPRPPTCEEAESLSSPRPIIQNVEAKRDTLTISSTQRFSLSMRIEELERSLAGGSQQLSSSRTPSICSSDHTLDDDFETRPVSPPSPLRLTPSPPYYDVVDINTSTSTSTSTPPVPTWAKSRPGIGEAITHDDPAMVPIPLTPALHGLGASTHSRRPSPADSLRAAQIKTPQFRDPNWTRNFSPPGSDTGSFYSANNSGFQFSAPLTPDSANWPLGTPVSPFTAPTPSSPTPSSSKIRSTPRPSAHQYQGLALQPPGIVRARVPPPLNFSAPTSSPQQWTSQRSLGSAMMGDDLGSGPGPDTGRSVMSPLSPALASSKVCSPLKAHPLDRGVSVKERRDRTPGERRPDHGLKSPSGFADEHGTVFI